MIMETRDGFRMVEKRGVRFPIPTPVSPGSGSTGHHGEMSYFDTSGGISAPKPEPPAELSRDSASKSPIGQVKARLKVFLKKLNFFELK